MSLYGIVFSLLANRYSLYYAQRVVVMNLHDLEHVAYMSPERTTTLHRILEKQSAQIKYTLLN